MGSNTEKKLKEAFETIFNELSIEDNDGLEALLQPLRIYVGDIGRFHTQQIFVSKFRKFLEMRDQALASIAVLEEQGQTENARRYQEEINLILDQVLELLTRNMNDTDSISQNLENIVEKLEKAKTINNVRALTDAFVNAGREMVEGSRTIRDGLAKLSTELHRCKAQIEDLESELEDTKSQADQDHLTQLGNRRAFDRDFNEAVDRAHRFNNPLCLLLIDLDNFKEVNDTYGHQVGDDVLVNFGKLIKTSLRDFDLTYRIGGDEFSVIFSGCNLSRAQGVGDRLRQFLAKHQYKVGDVEFRLTLSGGLAQLAEGETAKQFYKRTDRCLYTAKSQGRNQIYGEEPSAE